MPPPEMVLIMGIIGAHRYRTYEFQTPVNHCSEVFLVHPGNFPRAASNFPSSSSGGTHDCAADDGDETMWPVLAMTIMIVSLARNLFIIDYYQGDQVGT
jgi:hypothetical protein